jgi:hypothetical protein
LPRGTPIRAVMFERLGPVVWHRSPAEASAVLEELEETATLWLMCRPTPAPMTEAQIASLRQQFGAIWQVAGHRRTRSAPRSPRRGASPPPPEARPRR